MKTLFIIKPHSIVDIITNSSSELFTGFSDSKQALEDLIKHVYPDYLDEYVPLKHTSELSNDELEMFIHYNYHTWSNRRQKMITNVVPGFKFEEMYEMPEWCKDRKEYYIKHDFVNDDTRDRVIQGIDPKSNTYFMFSKDENPNWEMQEKLMEIMDRYHLG